MIDDIFDWSGDWSQYDTWQFAFHNVTMRRDLGSFKTGTKVLQAFLDIRKGSIGLTNNMFQWEYFDIQLNFKEA